MKIEIEQINNGYILSWQVEAEKNVFRTEKEVIEDNDDDEKKVMTILLHKISNYFGLSYDKWGKENLRISWDKKGRKV